jgi:hypothetical protein
VRSSAARPCAADAVNSSRCGPRALRTRIMPQRLELATEVMGTDAGFHADQTRGHIGKACFDLATRPLLPQHDCATAIETNDVEPFLLISMPITAIALCAVVAMACSLSWRPGQLIAGGAGARPDHPIGGAFAH